MDPELYGVVDLSSVSATSSNGINATVAVVQLAATHATLSTRCVVDALLCGRTRWLRCWYRTGHRHLQAGVQSTEGLTGAACAGLCCACRVADEHNAYSIDQWTVSPEQELCLPWLALSV